MLGTSNTIHETPHLGRELQRPRILSVWILVMHGVKETLGHSVVRALAVLAWRQERTEQEMSRSVSFVTRNDCMRYVSECCKDALRLQKVK